MKQRILIGIDPDCDKSGFAVYHPATKQLSNLKTFDLTNLFNEIMLKAEQFDITVKLEAGWLKPGTWHKGGNGQAKRVGANHEIGRQIEKFLQKNGVKYDLILPQGYSSWKHDQFVKYTGWQDKTNSETRVAGMLVFGY